MMTTGHPIPERNDLDEYADIAFYAILGFRVVLAPEAGRGSSDQ